MAEQQYWEKREKGGGWVGGRGVQIKPPVSKAGSRRQQLFLTSFCTFV